MITDSDKEEQFTELTVEEVLSAASMDPQLDYTFYKVGKLVETWMERCPDIRTWEEGTGTDIITRA